MAWFKLFSRNARGVFPIVLAIEQNQPTAFARMSAAESAGAPPRLVVFSADDQVKLLAERAAPAPWVIDIRTESGNGREALAHPNVRMVILDDESVEEEARGWLLDRIRRFVPNALIIYVSSAHSPEAERRARGHSVQYYIAKPLDLDRLGRVLGSFISAAAQSPIR
jgi:CheY-like chemotaxis protein